MIMILDPMSFNLYGYVRGNPVMGTDPTGEYGRGKGFTDDQWKKYNEMQQKTAKDMNKTADKFEKKAEKLEKKAAKLGSTGKDGKKKAKKLGEAAGLRNKAQVLREGAAPLQSDGLDGYVMNAYSAEEYAKLPNSTKAGVASAGVGGKIMNINLDAKVWKTGGIQGNLVLGHESLHSAGYDHQLGSNGEIAYKFGYPENIAAFNELKGTVLGIINPDNLMDEVY